MDELIYLSKSKLSQFIENPRGLRISDGEGELKLPFVTAKLKGSQVPDDGVLTSAKKLRAVQKNLELRKAIPPRWDSDTDLSNGNWVRFEAEFVYAVLRLGARSLFFATQEISCAIGDLVLFGSPSSLLVAPDDSSSSSPGGNLSSLDALRGFIQALRHEDHDTWNQSANHYLAALELIVATLRTGDLFAVDHLTGWAKVFKIIDRSRGTRFETDSDRLIVASPLFLQAISHD